MKILLYASAFPVCRTAGCVQGCVEFPKTIRTIPSRSMMSGDALELGDDEQS